MKQFSLEEYLKQPSRKVETREGRPVRIICTDSEIPNYPIIGLVKNPHDIISVEVFKKSGAYTGDKEHDYDLFFAPEKHEGWVSIYRDLESGELYCGSIFDSKEGAKKRGSIAIAKIEWEE